MDERLLSGKQIYLMNVREWSMGDTQLFPPTIVSPALKETGGYRLLPADKPTFRIRPNLFLQEHEGLRRRTSGSGWTGRSGCLAGSADLSHLSISRTTTTYLGPTVHHCGHRTFFGVRVDLTISACSSGDNCLAPRRARAASTSHGSSSVHVVGR